MKNENPSIGYTKLEIIMNCRKRSNFPRMVIMWDESCNREENRVESLFWKERQQAKHNCKSNLKKERKKKNGMKINL